MSRQAEDLLFDEWRKYSQLAKRESMGGNYRKAQVYRAITDQLQYLLQDWSEYGHRLVFGEKHGQHND